MRPRRPDTVYATPDRGGGNATPGPAASEACVSVCDCEERKKFGCPSGRCPSGRKVDPEERAQRDNDKAVGCLVVLAPLVLIDWYFNDLGFLKAMWRNWMFALTLIEQLLSDVVSGRFSVSRCLGGEQAGFQICDRVGRRNG